MSAPQQWGAPPPVRPPRTPIVGRPSRTTDSSPSTDGPRTPPHTASAPPLRQGLIASNPGAYTRRLPDGVNAAPDDPLVLTVQDILRADSLGMKEFQFGSALDAFLSLPYRHRTGKVSVVGQLDLASVGVRDGPQLHDVALFTRVVRWLSEVRPSSSSSASSSSAPPSPLTVQLQQTARRRADDDNSGIRLPDFVFAATMSEAIPATFTVSATVELKSDVEQSIKGLLQCIFYVAQMHELTGAQLGLYQLRTRFVRLFALSPQLVAVEQLRGVDVAPDDAGDRQQCRLAADEFLDVLDATSNAQIATKLPWDLRAAPGSGESSIDWAAVSVLGAFSLAAWHQLLDLPAAAPFLRFSGSSEGQLAALASTDTLPLLEDERALTAAAFARTKLRKWRKGSRRKAGSGDGRSAPASGDSDRGGQGGAGPSTKGKRATQTSRRTHTTTAKRRRATQAGGRGSSAASANDDLLQRDDAGSAADDDDEGCDADDNGDDDTESDDESDESDAQGGHDESIHNVAAAADWSWPLPACYYSSRDEIDDDSTASDATLDPAQVYRAFRHSGLEVLMVGSSTMDDLIGGLSATTPATVGAASSKSALPLEQLNGESAPLEHNRTVSHGAQRFQGLHWGMPCA
ncbi:uncharacterized protein LOC62_02G002952 [Vanrija pseudolonga]|uniref:Uncharacterized protein n=1 Tax=Vanrija pseudolonga TaxID=143232 RepID=A0AAF0Y7P0_9TREE|nr:hypothetical protein LOC62_02G002952 [Vanrija pseudolonga]